MKLTLLALLSTLTVSFPQSTPYAPETRFPRPLSPLAKHIYKAVFDSATTNPRKSSIDASLMASSGTFVRQLLDYGNTTSFYDQVYSPIMAQTKQELLLNSFIFAKDTPLTKGIYEGLKNLSDTIIREKRTPVQVYILMDPYGALYFNNQLAPTETYVHTSVHVDPSEFGLPTKKEVPGLNIQMKSFHKGVFGIIHDKLLISDARHVLLGSKNVDADICQEYMMEWKGTVAGTLRHSFERMWGEPLPPVRNPITEPNKGDLPIVVFGRNVGSKLTSHNANQPQAAGLLAAFDAAKKEIFLQTLNFGEKRIAQKVVDTVKRGVKVTILTAYRMANMQQRLNPLAIGTNYHTYKWMAKQFTEEEKKLFTFCWWIGKRNKDPKPQPDPKEWSHVKFISIDDEVAIVGSANMDPYSWYYQHEFNIAIDDAQMTRKLKQDMLDQIRSLEPGNCSHIK